MRPSSRSGDPVGAWRLLRARWRASLHAGLENRFAGEPSDYPRPMSNESMIEVEADEIRVLADQLRANPPDDLVRVGAVNGVLIAEWTCSGTTNKVGPSVTKNLP